MALNLCNWEKSWHFHLFNFSNLHWVLKFHLATLLFLVMIFIFDGGCGEDPDYDTQLFFKTITPTHSLELFRPERAGEPGCKCLPEGAGNRRVKACNHVWSYFFLWIGVWGRNIRFISLEAHLLAAGKWVGHISRK